MEQDLSRALEEEYDHQLHADIEHDRDVELAHTLGHHEVLAVEGEHELYIGSELHGHHEVEDVPSWRDHHEHTGFDLKNQQEDGVEHLDNEKLHQAYSAASATTYGQ